MSFTVKADLQGDRELKRKLEELGGSAGRRAVRKAVNAGGTPILRATRSAVAANRRTGALRRSLAKRSKSYATNGVFLVVVGARNRRQKIGGRTVNPANYAHLLEGGARPHTIRARRRRALAFVGGSVAGSSGQTSTIQVGRRTRSYRQVVRREFHHPGHRGTRFRDRAFAVSRQSAERAFAEKLDAELISEMEKA